ncbi:hypothetical protein V8F20_001284 [Naviculisporaceae sp. PSN 640]
MKITQFIAMIAAVGCAAAQGVTSVMTPPYDAPASCLHSVEGKFEILHGIDHGDLDKRGVEAYQGGVCSPSGSLVAELKNGILTDAKGRIGYIASNFQFQFDDPPQSGAIFTAGWAHCPNGSLALGATTWFYKCRSGGFFNVYDRFWAEQCEPLHLVLRQCDETGGLDGNYNDHVVGSATVTTTIVVPLEDGAPQVITTVVAEPLCEIDAGALKGQTTPCAAVAGMPPADATMAPLSELDDGQIQITPIAPQPPLHSTEMTVTPPVSTTTFAPPPTTTLAPPATTPAPSTSTSDPPERPETISSSDAVEGIPSVFMPGFLAGSSIHTPYTLSSDHPTSQNEHSTMAEYWKSTPKYWCKHCGVFVRDTKLERANHEATGKHQGAIKRSLRELHRGAEREEREKERVKRELERLEGVVSGSSASGAGTKSGGAQRQGPAQSQQTQQVTEQDRQRQLEQLAELGVNIPTELRGNLAMAGEWTVTSTRVIGDDDENKNADSKKAVGVKRARERTEEEKETEEALNGLFKAKKPRRWGIDSKRVAGGQEDQELEALLSGGIGPLKTKTEEVKQEGDEVVKKEEEDSAEVEGGDQVKKEEESLPEGGEPIVKKEPDEQDGDTGLAVFDAKVAGPDGTDTVPGAAGKSDLDLSAVGGLFKKKKAKNLRQK